MADRKENLGVCERHIMVAVDSSENSRRAVTYVGSFFSDYQDIFVTILSIIRNPSEDLFPTEEKQQQWLAEKKTEMEQVMQEYRQILLDSGLSEQQVQSRLIIRECDSIADAILEERRNLNCGIIVVGRRGLSHKEEFIFGSTSNRILHHAKQCAVMVVE